MILNRAMICVPAVYMGNHTTYIYYRKAVNIVWFFLEQYNII